MKVVRKTRSGMRALSFFSRSAVCACGGRFIPSRTRFDMCCKGMSIYLHTCRTLQMSPAELCCASHYRLGSSQTLPHTHTSDIPYYIIKCLTDVVQWVSGW